MSHKLLTILSAGTIAASLAFSPALAAQFGNDSAGFNAWKAAFAVEAKRAGVSSRGLAALAGKIEG